ncbi:short-chain fatty acid transporter [Macrococcus animalis]|uniref:short-chain fatty acid transporter n=1 Tax=Macrococcus animalis TaxID=3395467 RepID=UPI0039BDF512
MKALTRLSTRLMERFLPDPLVIVILLTLFVYGIGIFTTNTGPVEMITFWGDGFWALLSFTIQMALILLLGHVMAMSKPFSKLLRWLARLPRTAGQAIIMVSFVAALACFINWGFGLVLGVLYAKEVARVRDDTDYRLLIASSYSGFLIWHGGLSGSIPLTIATKGHPFEKQMGLVPVNETIFSPWNLLLVAVLMISIPILNYFMHPKKENRFIIDKNLLVENTNHEEVIDKSKLTPAERIEHSVILNYLIGLVGLIYIVYFFMKNGFNLNLDIVNFIFLFVGLILHGTPRNYIDAVNDAAKGVGSILIQFPFYAGLMGMMTQSGVAKNITDTFLNISNEQTFPALAFLSAGVVNFFVPSGGGQWAVQGPIMIEAAKELGVSNAVMSMAIAWGDAWTNMIQPFWALPALAIAGLKAKDIMGFCLFVLILSGVIICATFLII